MHLKGKKKKGKKRPFGQASVKVQIKEFCKKTAEEVPAHQWALGTDGLQLPDLSWSENSFIPGEGIPDREFLYPGGRGGAVTPAGASGTRLTGRDSRMRGCPPAGPPPGGRGGPGPGAHLRR